MSSAAFLAIILILSQQQLWLTLRGKAKKIFSIGTPDIISYLPVKVTSKLDLPLH